MSKKDKTLRSYCAQRISFNILRENKKSQNIFSLDGPFSHVLVSGSYQNNTESRGC